VSEDRVTQNPMIQNIIWPIFLNLFHWS
jgi:hypothetical protein